MGSHGPEFTAHSQGDMRKNFWTPILHATVLRYKRAASESTRLSAPFLENYFAFEIFFGENRSKAPGEL
jgi:hypothetical protein